MSLSPSVDDPAPPAVDVARTWNDRLGRPARGPLLLGLLGSLMMLVGSFGAGGTLLRDPILTNSPLGFWRYGHGGQLAALLVYGGVVLMVWAWIRLGRGVLAGQVSGRAVVTTSAVWTFPLLFGPPLFTRDVYSYLAQGALPLFGFDPYAVGPDAMPGVISENVHYFWQGTPAPYGPLFILIAKGVAAIVGDNMILGVFLMRLALLPGLVLLIWAVPGLTRRLGGRVPVAFWALVANPVMVILMIGGGHNDLLVIGLLAAGAVVALRGVQIAGRDAGPAFGIALVTMGMAVKASAGVALPFLVLVWAMRMRGTQFVRIMKAIGAGVVVFVATFAACTLAAGVNLGWLPALSAPSMIVNWMSLPTGAGELLHSIVSIFATVPKQLFVNVMRAIGGIILIVLAVRHWLAARDAGPDAIRRAGVVLLLVAILSPALLPWYVSWGFVLLAATALSLRWLQVVAFVSPMLVICYYPSGEDGLYNPPYLLICAALSLLGAVSLARRDPLRLAAGARSKTPAAGATAPTLTAVPSSGEPTLTTAVPVEEPAGHTPAGAQQHAG